MAVLKISIKTAAAAVFGAFKGNILVGQKTQQDGPSSGDKLELFFLLEKTMSPSRHFDPMSLGTLRDLNPLFF